MFNPQRLIISTSSNDYRRAYTLADDQRKAASHKRCPLSRPYSSGKIVQSIQASAVGTSILAGTAEALPHKALSEVFNGSLVEVGGKVAIAPIPLGTADLMIHHIHAFQIHVTVLILLKGVLYARSSILHWSLP